ncbi:MAG TPA: exonuclease SbcCD subunit D [Armatimonadota bacterium]|nr:exonuclease SbcCD subunit D [Armatimonadota bacterium]
MKPIKIMHFADAHFGIETYGKVDPETGLNTRLADFGRSLNLAIDKALEAGVHLALFAGDAYKSRDPNQTHQREFASCIHRLTDAGVPVVMIAGNHDLPNAKGRANAIEIYRTLGVENIHILSRPEVRRIETAAGPVQIAGVPYLLRSNVLSREECRNKTIQETTDLMVRKYCDYVDYVARHLEPEIPSVLLGHFWIKNAKVSSQAAYLNVAEPEVLVSSVANPAFDYVAMGHIHKFQDLNKRRTPPVVYCGGIERIDFSERNEEKGFVLVELAKGSASYEFINIPARRFVEIEVDADADDPTAKILGAIRQSDVEDAVVKLLYHISQERLSLVREAEIREALSPAFLVVSITKDVIRDTQAVRSRLLNEALDPVQALEMYFDTRDDYRKRKSELMDYARPLIEDLLAEEQVK